MHTGSTFGYRAIVTLIPAINAGLFTAFTGDDPGFIFRTNLHLYMADLLLGHDPWLDNSTVCSFPEPWKRKTDDSTSKRPSTDIGADKELSKYEGQFSNKAYGRIEIYLNDSAGFLMAKVGFGRFILYPKSKADAFYAQGYEIMGNVRDFSTFQFSFKHDTVTSLTIPSFESEDPPIFNRIKRNESNGTERPNASKSKLNILLFYLILLTVYLL